MVVVVKDTVVGDDGPAGGTCQGDGARSGECSGGRHDAVG